MIRVYVAGALNADNAIDVMKNAHRMIKCGNELSLLGFAVFVPALDFIWQIQTGDVEYDRIFNNSQPWLEVSDVVFLTPGWESSEGTKREIALAKNLGIPIFNNIKEIELWNK